ncbi:hypothetical protein TNCV_2499341 [Trichonephila clavipes]|nr:hypothetical protein TNCV_2499341 [Trichonephila clavipes]
MLSGRSLPQINLGVQGGIQGDFHILKKERQKDDLRTLATELCLVPSNNLKIIELKDLINNSDRYDEEFVKDMLSVIVEERTVTEKQKVAELEEKPKAVVVVQQREREFELEKMKIQLEMEELSQAPVASQ